MGGERARARANTHNVAYNTVILTLLEGFFILESFMKIDFKIRAYYLIWFYLDKFEKKY